MIDHVFAPTTLPVLTVTVGSEDPWRHRSDRAPVVVDLEMPDRTQA
jgi:endonuclease/exonuclease/phosphatase family metal-dependent hydrolase